MSTRKRLVAGNWKMHLTQAEAKSLLVSYVKKLESSAEVEVVVCPSFTLLWCAQQTISGSCLHLGAQDVFWMDKGAYTSQVSPQMLLDAGVSYCIVGHSETRGRFGNAEAPKSTISYFGETDKTINLKIKALLNAYIDPILCVGETLEERDRNITDDVLREQICGALSGVGPSQLFHLVVAYEPVWAIGTGKTCDVKEADRVCGFIRSVIAEIDHDAAQFIRVLYGGSVKPSNAKELFSCENVDGGLIGGASLNAEEFLAIIDSA